MKNIKTYLQILFIPETEVSIALGLPSTFSWCKISKHCSNSIMWHFGSAAISFEKHKNDKIIENKTVENVIFIFIFQKKRNKNRYKKVKKILKNFLLRITVFNHKSFDEENKNSKFYLSVEAKQWLNDNCSQIWKINASFIVNLEMFHLKS